MILNSTELKIDNNPRTSIISRQRNIKSIANCRTRNLATIALKWIAIVPTPRIFYVRGLYMFVGWLSRPSFIIYGHSDVSPKWLSRTIYSPNDFLSTEVRFPRRAVCEWVLRRNKKLLIIIKSRGIENSQAPTYANSSALPAEFCFA